MTEDSDVLKDYVHAALLQWQYTLPLLLDKREALAGTKIIYSVDADIVKLFTNPVGVAAPVRGRSYGYLQLFFDDRREECIARGRVIANYIFRSLHHGKPLLVIPPLNKELIGLYDSAAQQAHDQQFATQRQLSTLKIELDSVRETKDKEKLLEYVASKAPDLVRLIEGDQDATSELRRFSILFRDRLVAEPEFLISRKLFDTQILSALQAPERWLDLELDLNRYREAWVGSVGKPGGRARRWRADVEAMARIQLINKLLPSNVKLVHITGDSYLFSTGRDIFPDGGDLSFAELYLRHPRAFLAEPDILLVDKSIPQTELNDSHLEASATDFSEFSRWLIVFLAKFWKRDYAEIYENIGRSGEAHSPKHDMGDDAIEEFCRDFPEVVSAFRSGWDDFSQKLTLGHAGKMIESMPYMRNLSGLLRLSFEEIESRITDIIDESWRSSFQYATATSYGITRISSDRAAKRGSAKRGLARSIPLIMFERFPKSRDFVKLIIQSSSFVNLGDQRYSDLFAAIDNEDSSGYLYYLAYATLFAAEGRWRLARILADRSFGLRHRSQNSIISGREAAYFSAVAIRNSARTPEQLAVAERWLDVAQQCWEEDKITHPTLRIDLLRFDLERDSLAAAKEFFAIFSNRPPTSPDDAVTTLKEINDRFSRALLSVSAQLNEASKYNDYEVWIAQNLERRALINILMNALIRKYYFDRPIVTDEWDDIQQHYLALTRNVATLTQPAISDSYLYNVVWLVASVWLAKEHSEFEKMALDVLTDEEIAAHEVMPYDTARFHFFRSVLDRIR